MKATAIILLIFVMLTIVLTGCGANEEPSNQIKDDNVNADEDPVGTTDEFIDEDDYVEIGEMI